MGVIKPTYGESARSLTEGYNPKLHDPFFDGFKDVNIAQRGANTVITFDGERGHSITLRHFDADNISADDFLF